MTSEFKNKIKKVTSKRNYKVTNSLGVYDAYKYIRKNKWFNIERPIKQEEFYSIIRGVNKLIVKELLLGLEITLPHKMGTIQLRKKVPTIKLVNGKIKTDLPINWDLTLSLWEEDSKEYNNRTLIHVETDYLYRIYYNKNKADYNNKSFYLLNPVRLIKKLITLASRNNNIDAFLYKR